MAEMKSISAKEYRYILKVDRNKRRNAHRGDAVVAQNRCRRCLVCNARLPMVYEEAICPACQELRGYHA